MIALRRAIEYPKIPKGCTSVWQIPEKMAKMKNLVKQLKKDEVKKITPSDKQQLKAYLKGAAKIVYRNTNAVGVKQLS
ncbi:hypothetical protein QUA40_15845 [Microcoleus sp. Pol11C3]|uniref:hypothetical protein n=1 Tax=Microcoleus sp. Pol11C3 TaxID=3055390 RepID=UPI002FD0E3DC